MLKHYYGDKVLVEFKRLDANTAAHQGVVK